MFTYNYPRAALTVDAIVIGKDDGRYKIVLIERQNDPFKGKWALPGGFINMDETLETACKRELFEETGLNFDKLDFMAMYDAIDRDPRGRTISAVYFKIIPHCPLLIAGDDAAKARWIAMDDLPPLSFDHARIISDFLQSGYLS